MGKSIRDDDLNALFEAILSLESADECYALFSDLCTVNELIALKQRFKVARLLKEGRVYSEIVGETGASTATISRINRCLNYGEGYSAVLEKSRKTKR